jgi:hypothetical protein
MNRYYTAKRDADRSRAKAKRAYEGDEETPW